MNAAANCNLIAGFDPIQNRRLAVGRFADSNRAHGEPVGCGPYEDYVLTVHLLDGIGLHQQRGLRLPTGISALASISGRSRFAGCSVRCEPA